MEALKLLVDKLSQYNFLTNILPGTVLCLILKHSGYDIIPFDNWFLTGIVFYFIGMVNNRFSSLVIEWICKKIHFTTFAPYKSFVIAEKKDSKITTLSMENNIFRSYISVFTLSLIALLYKNLSSKIIFLAQCQDVFLLVCLLVLFGFSYRKQTNYIRKRVEANQ